MDRGAGAGARADFIRGARVVAICDQDSSDAKPGKLFEVFISRLDGINAEVAGRVADEMTVKIVTVRL
jgi:hypothetical protein